MAMKVPINKTCTRSSCGASILRTDPHEFCLLHRSCKRTKPCSLCINLSIEEWDSIDRRKVAVAAKRPKDNGDKSSYRRSDSESKKEKAPVAQDELTSTPMPDPSPIDTAPNQYYVLEEVHNNPLPVMGNQPTPSTLTSSENDNNNLFNNFLSFFQKAQSGGSQDSLMGGP